MSATGMNMRAAPVLDELSVDNLTVRGEVPRQIAGAYLRDGRTDGGAHGASGEIGHVVIRPDGPECGCGQRGCVEALASAAAIARRYVARTGQPASAADVVTRAGQGDPASPMCRSSK